MKGKLIFKGGAGSGNFGHSGRPGHVGGSGGGSAIDFVTIGDSYLSKIANDPQMLMIAAGLAADGSIDDVANVTALIDDIMGTELEYTQHISTTESNDAANKIYEQYEKLTVADGYKTTGSGKVTVARRDWERAVYGKDVKGFQTGEAYAGEVLRDYLTTGKKPKNNFPFMKLDVGAQAKKLISGPNKAQLEFLYDHLDRLKNPKYSADYASYGGPEQAEKAILAKIAKLS